MAKSVGTEHRVAEGESFFERRREVADPKLLEPAPAVAGGAG